jgi:hypothetical protein
LGLTQPTLGAGSVYGAATHAVGGDKGYGLLRLLR